MIHWIDSGQIVFLINYNRMDEVFDNSTYK
jgi:hypothetical protein